MNRDLGDVLGSAARLLRATNPVYREVARLLDVLTRLFPAYISHTDPELPDGPLLILDTPEGQLSWPISPLDLPILDHVPVIEGIEPDGATGEEKYERLRTLCTKLPKMTYAHPVYGQP
jgi:hypothetical protein